ncbi:MAG: hypothetical protein ACRDUB_04620 [Mycobacterium sp.]
MDIDGEQDRELATLSVPMLGRLKQTGDPWLPFRLVDGGGAVVEGVSVYFRDLQAAGKPETTIRSYGMDLLRWFRFLWAIDVPWHRATRIEARDFSRWMLLGGKPVRPHWRRPTIARQPVDAVSPIRRRCVRTVKRCCGPFMTSTSMLAPVRCSTRSPWTERGEAAAPMPITIRWNRTAMSPPVSTGR